MTDECRTHTYQNGRKRSLRLLKKHFQIKFINIRLSSRRNSDLTQRVIVIQVRPGWAINQFYWLIWICGFKVKNWFSLSRPVFGSSSFKMILFLFMMIEVLHVNMLCLITAGPSANVNFPSPATTLCTLKDKFATHTLTQEGKFVCFQFLLLKLKQKCFFLISFVICILFSWRILFLGHIMQP